MMDVPENNEEENQELDFGDSMQTQQVSPDFDTDDEVNFVSALDTRPAVAGQRRTIRFYVPQEVEPLIFFDPNHLIIGRGGKGVHLDVNLSEQYGWMLGVSRQHAEIVYDDGQYYIADLNSTNGTYLNRTQLDPNERYPLASSDQIRLGHFLMIVSIP